MSEKKQSTNFWDKLYWATFVFISILVVALYYQTAKFEIVNLDDKIFIFDKQNLYGGWGTVLDAFKNGVFNDIDNYYRPLLNISFHVDHLLYGTNVELWLVSFKEWSMTTTFFFT